MILEVLQEETGGKVCYFYSDTVTWAGIKESLSIYSRLWLSNFSIFRVSLLLGAALSEPYAHQGIYCFCTCITINW